MSNKNYHGNESFTITLTIAIAFRWMKIEKVVFIQTNRSFDLSGPVELAKFRVLIHSKMEHKINKIRRNLYVSGKLKI